ncbi:MAG: NADPH-dependent 7-cyano-7-deazaguanine reductase QueF [Gammaproteobacteria bacterium]|nr:NADPH-dependent 7-cyano-7-deazaguanine reductase QueF [Gammaproteobacteria bacterium]
MTVNFTLNPSLELGKHSSYVNQYDASTLFPIERKEKRLEIGIDLVKPPFYGHDIWNHYEVSCLNLKGKPMVFVAMIRYDCHSPCIIESKSMKLYFNTFNNSRFENTQTLAEVIQKDISSRVKAAAEVTLHPLHQAEFFQNITDFNGRCLDDLDISLDKFELNPSVLKTTSQIVEEKIFSHLLKSNCLVTHQPDWGSVFIHYQGPKIIDESLLEYIVSFRDHNEFHEQCIERIFVDIMRHCKPTMLTVYGRYTRRGGLDINPIRSTEKDIKAPLLRLIRQ